MICPIEPSRLIWNLVHNVGRRGASVNRAGRRFKVMAEGQTVNRAGHCGNQMTIALNSAFSWHSTAVVLFTELWPLETSSSPDVLPTYRV